jgi:phosphatidate cytidylyltransferase
LLKQRIKTAVILGVLLLAFLFFLPFEIFAWLALAIFGYGAFEWSKLAEIKLLPNQIMYAVGAVLLGATVYISLLDQTLWTLDGRLTEDNLSLMSFACVWWIASSILVLIYPRGNRVWQHQPIMKSIFGYLTLIPAWLALLTIRQWDYQFDANNGAWLSLFVFGIVWAADIGAYFAGKKFGSHKLMPRVSPGKTMEGFIGGMVAVAILAIAVMYKQQIDIADWLVLVTGCVVIGVISAFGDLSESMLKRDAGIKDSGNILPGHGGLLDRIDSLTAAMPVFLVLFSHFYL